VAALLCIFLEGPRLGPFYDFLLRRRPALPVYRELLIINSAFSGQEFGDDILEPGAAASLLYTMAELDASTLIIQVPILGLSAGASAGEEEILNRFDEEFSILSRNIRNLFDAIRTGSVAPGESARYVGELVELSEKGKERLVSALVRRDEEGIVSMEKAAAFFGHVRRPGDLRVQLIRTGEGGRPGVLAESGEYSRARPDRDGVLRRVAPVLTVPDLSDGKAGEKTLEHIIYGALKSRFRVFGIEPTGSKSAGLESAGSGQALVMRNGPEDRETRIPLDKNGALLFELPHNKEDFRRIGISDFLAYDENDRNLRRLLQEADALGIYRGIEGEDNPFILYDYALSIREEVASSFRNGDEEKKLIWQEARKGYFDSLENFLYGPEEMKLVGSFESIIASESKSGDMAETRDSLIQAFATLRIRHKELLVLREKLESALSSSFCILGSNVDAEASALLANSILSGRAVKPGNEKYLLLGSALSILITCVILKSRGAASTLGSGLFMILLFVSGFSLVFIFSGIWFDPLVPAASNATGVLFSFFWALIARAGYSRRFRLAYGPFVSRPCLKSFIRAGKPFPSQTVNAWAAVVAVQSAAKKTSGTGMQAVLEFQEKVSNIFRKAGGTVTGTEGDMVIICFGSPLERIHLAGKRNAATPENNTDSFFALSAVDLVSEIACRPDCESWHFGLDVGNCSFAWSAVSGYFALGAPIQKAKILSRLAGRDKVQVILSDAAHEALSDLPVKKLDILKAKDAEEPYYKLAVNNV
jgi:class 3 adenylate cyclase